MMRKKKKSRAWNAPLVVMLALLMVGAITGDETWSYVGLGFGVLAIIVLFAFAFGRGWERERRRGR